ncbi:hypothetical protein RND81_02G161800 [Saponaria officinalis]|uniref:CASP-like protein n=1 Tax=Saponaria officinalis TaxID=3572 RepID=A0AAW1MM05_SAPOF
MASNNGEAKSSANNLSKGMFIAQVVLRSVTGMLAFVATMVMVKSSQSTMIFGIEFQAKFSYASAFRFFVGINIAICAASLISLIAICIFFNGPKSKSNHFFALFLHDMTVMLLSMAGCSAASAIGYVGKYGQDQIGWPKICDEVTKFCNFVMVSIVFSYLAFICLFALTITVIIQAHNASTNLLNKD